MQWGDLTTAAIAVSLASLFIRWRFPAVPAYLASAGLGASLCVVALSFLHPPIELAASITLNIALLSGFADQRFLKSDATAHQDATSATLTLNFPLNGQPVEVSNQNVHSWSARTMGIATMGEDGAVQRQLFTHWLIPVWFMDTIWDYQVEVSNLAGRPVLADVSWRTERGIFIHFEAPNEAAVIRIHVSQRIGA